MAKELPYFKMYPKDFDTDESARLMDIREAGLYLYCLNHAWINEGLPSDPEEISRALRVGRTDFNAAWPRVSKCFILRAGRLINQRQEEERDDAISKGRTNSKAAELRWKRQRERELAEANAMRTHSERNATNTDAMRTHSELTDETSGIQDDISYLDDMSTNGANGHANASNPQCERIPNAVPRAYESDVVTTSHVNGKSLKAEESKNGGYGNYRSDGSFSHFVIAATQFWGSDLIEEDLSQAWMFSWKRFDFEQKLAATKKLQARIEAGEDCRFVTRLPKYLENGAWKRPPRLSTHVDGNSKPDQKSKYQVVQPPQPPED